MAFAFSKLTNRNTLRLLLILFASSVISLGLYLAVSADYFRVGFPLDDSWIHLTYARNLALNCEWAFIPGQLSAGSTAPLWTILLAFGFLFNLGPYIWTFFLGGLVLFLLAATMEFWARNIIKFNHVAFPVVGLFFVFEWHLAWAAVSGMETILQAFLITIVLIMLAKPLDHPIVLGFLCGLSIWVRPDGLTLLGPVLLTWFMGKKNLPILLKFSGGFVLIALIYVLFNLGLSGHPFPNTFYAKQAEYLAWQSEPLIKKISLTTLSVLTGPSLLLVPGIIIWLFRSIRLRDWGTISGLIWAIGYILIYAIRLPPYQHGRYLIPTMPVLYLWGLLGLLQFLQDVDPKRWKKLIKVGWVASLSLVTIGFIWMGARTYARDVAYIETEMVTTAKWAQTNLPPDALIAAHDIGALGYFDTHKLIDLAGLVSPQVIPFMRDEDQIAQYLDLTGVDYFIAFPDLYPELAARSRKVFSSNGEYATQLGGENLSIFQWQNLLEK
jgi:hypothetical protein